MVRLYSRDAWLPVKGWRAKDQMRICSSRGRSGKRGKVVGVGTGVWERRKRGTEEVVRCGMVGR